MLYKHVSAIPGLQDMTESSAVTSFADHDMYAHFIGFGVGHNT